MRGLKYCVHKISFKVDSYKDIKIIYEKTKYVGKWFKTLKPT